MYTFTLLCASLLPGLAWVWFFYRQDRGEKEPKALILWTFLAGMAAVVPAAALEAPFRPWLGGEGGDLGRFVATLVVVGLGEEGLKLLATYGAAFRRSAFNEPSDGIIYAVTASLGFAALENLLYAHSFGLGVAPVRTVVTSLAHASFGGVAGLYLGAAKVRGGVGTADVFKGLAAAALLHGLYDYFILSRLVHPLVSLALVYATYRFITSRMRAWGAPVRGGPREGG